MTRQYAAIGPSFFSGDAADYRNMAKKYDDLGAIDPDAGGYHLNELHWNSDTGVASFSTTDALSDGWISAKPGCTCEEGDKPCRCQ